MESQERRGLHGDLADVLKPLKERNIDNTNATVAEKQGTLNSIFGLNTDRFGLKTCKKWRNN